MVKVKKLTKKRKKKLLKEKKIMDRGFGLCNAFVRSVLDSKSTEEVFDSYGRRYGVDAPNLAKPHNKTVIRLSR